MPKVCATSDSSSIGLRGAAGGEATRCFGDRRKLSWKGAGRADHCTIGLQERLEPWGHPPRVQEPTPDLGSGRRVLHDDRPNLAALILEVEYVEGDIAMVIVHAMPARDKYLR